MRKASGAMKHRILATTDVLARIKERTMKQKPNDDAPDAPEQKPVEPAPEARPLSDDDAMNLPGCGFGSIGE